MKLIETSIQDIIDKHLWIKDFEEDLGNPEVLDYLIGHDSDAIDKILFLRQQEEGSLLNEKSLRKLDFYEVEFTELARLGLAGGQHRPISSRDKEVDYDKDYSNMRLLIQDVSGSFGNYALFALYLKDYDFGYINPLGMCIYKFDFTDESWALYEEDPDAFIRKYGLLEIETVLWEDDFDLKKELYNYYHNIPDIGSAFIDQRVNTKSLLSVKEAAEKLGVSDARVKKMVVDELLDGYKYGTKLLIAESSVERRIDYIKEHGKPTRGKTQKGKDKRWTKPNNSENKDD